MPFSTLELCELIGQRRETRRLEFKGPETWSALRGKLIRAAMAMANTPDGGVIVVGVAEPAAGVFDPVGLSPDTAATFAADEMQSRVNEYADPQVSLEVSWPEY